MKKKIPIAAKESEILTALTTHQVIVVVGETGSGKTTGLPEMLYRAGYARHGQIGVTEPRKIAAISVAEFVDSEIRHPGVVGYQVRFDNETDRTTQIKFMTDGILLRELQSDPDLRRYAAIMIDEAHERSQNIDFTLGLIKDLLKRRTDLKIVIASATIDQEKFSRYFGNAPIINVSGRMYPVDIHWASTTIPNEDIIGAIAQKVEMIHRTTDTGDILVFLPGEEEIRETIKEIAARDLSHLVTVPLFGGLSYDDQKRALRPCSTARKVVIATNIAETSLTIDGIVYVIDSGLIKQSGFHPDRGIKSLDVVEHSQAGCNQRAGRAGRTQAGVCYRMYTEENFAMRPQFTKPEILRTSLASVVLAMEDIGIKDIENFDFIDMPDRKAFHEAYETLIALGAILKDRTGLTNIGRAMAGLPLEPSVARMLLEADTYKCVGPVCAIAAFLSVRNVFIRPLGKEQEADSAHRQFNDPRSDFLGYLKIWDAYEASGFSGAWARDNFLNAKALREVEKVGNQLADILEYHDIQISAEGTEEQILKAVASGLIHNLCQLVTRNVYTMAARDNYHSVFIHPGSNLFAKKPRWIVAAEVAETTRVFARGCSTVQTAWLPEIAPHLVQLGGVEIASMMPDTKEVLTKQAILFKGVSIGSIERTVSLEEARLIQQKEISSAIAKGWVRLVFRNASRSAFAPDLVAESGGKQYRSTRQISIQEGIPYYCEVVHTMLGIRSDRIEVEPKLKLTGLLTEEKQEPQPLSAPRVLGKLDLGTLKTKWGVRVR